ncbi:MAG: DUF262 domain-containing protein [Gammaproteobacteria bacterium]|nr:DUF262 domain-containing protein [Gammaproteobacteria bacterium]
MTETTRDGPLTERAQGGLPLPGGQTGYLVSLRRICTHVEEQDPTSKQLQQWMCRSFDSTPRVAQSQEQFLRKMGLLVESESGRLHLDESIRRWLSEGKHEIPIALIHRRLRFFGEMLAETAQLRSVGELVGIANSKYGFTWTKPNQVSYRLGWLESSGFVERREGGFIITPAGRVLLGQLELEPELAEGRAKQPHTGGLAPFEPPVAEADEDGLEPEVDDRRDIAEIKRPFDPQKIKVQSTTLLVAQMVARMNHGEMHAPEFQRKAGIWTAQRNSRLIESLLLRIPIPVFYFSADEDDNWSLVDGLQRTTAICDFVAGRFALRGLEYLTRYEGQNYSGLPRPMQRRIEETSLMANVIQPGTPEEVTFNIFSRINTGGMTLTSQEIRHALHKGPVLDFLKDLAQSNAFLEATGRSISDARMADRECVLRFMAFCDRRWQRYSASDDLDRWLGNGMTEINSMTDSERASVGQTFKSAMQLAQEIFGQYAFRKCYGPDDNRKRPVNKALFEVWSAGLARVLERRTELRARRSDLVEGFYGLMNQPDFEAAVSTATGTTKKVQHRFGAVEQLIGKCLSC